MADWSPSARSRSRDDDVSILTIPEVLVGRFDGRAFLTTVGDESRLPATITLHPVTPADPPRGLTFGDGARSGPSWMRAVADALARIAAGDLEKVVLARDVTARADAPIDLRYPIRRLAEDYPSCWTYAVDGLVGATPEMLVRLRDGLVTSRVLAGTTAVPGTTHVTSPSRRRSHDRARTSRSTSTPSGR